MPNDPFGFAPSAPKPNLILGKLPKPSRPRKPSKPSSKNSPNDKRLRDSANASEVNTQPDAVKKGLINQSANLIRASEEAGTSKNAKKDMLEQAAKNLEDYSIEDIQRVARTQGLAPSQIKALKRSGLLPQPSINRGPLSGVGDFGKDAFGTVIDTLSRGVQATTSGLAELNRGLEKKGLSLGDTVISAIPGVGQTYAAAHLGLTGELPATPQYRLAERVGKGDFEGALRTGTNTAKTLGRTAIAVKEGAQLKRLDTPVSIIQDTVDIRNKQGRSDNLAGFIDPKDLTTGVGGIATNIIGSILLDPLTYITFGVTALGKATAKTVLTLSMKELPIAVVPEFTGALRAGRAVEEVAAGLLKTRQITKAQAAAVIKSLKAEFGAVKYGRVAQLPEMRGGVRLNPMSVPGTRLVPKTGTMLRNIPDRVRKLVGSEEAAAEAVAKIATRNANRAASFANKTKLDTLIAPNPLRGSTAKLSEFVQNNERLNKLSKVVQNNERLNKLSKVFKGNEKINTTFNAFGSTKTKFGSQVSNVLKESKANAIAGADAPLSATRLNSKRLFGDKGLFSKLNPAEQALIKDAYFDPKVVSLTVGKTQNGVKVTEQVKEVFDGARDIGREQFDRLVEGKMLSEIAPGSVTRENYSPRIPSEAAKANRIEEAAANFAKTKKSDNANFLLERNIDPDLSVAEINKRFREGTLEVGQEGDKIVVSELPEFKTPESRNFDFLETDPAIAIEKRAIAQYNTDLKLTLGPDLKSKNVFVVAKENKVPDGFVKFDDPQMDKILGVEKGQSVYVPQEVKADFDRLQEVVLNKINQGGILDFYDGYLRIWKAYATVPFPLSTGFTLRNASGNIIANYMAGFVKNTYYVDAFKLQNKARALEKVEPGLLAEIMTGNRAVAELAEAINAAGPKRWKTVSLTWSPADVENLREAYKRNVVNKNFMYADLGSSANADSVTRPVEITPFANRSSPEFKKAEAKGLEKAGKRQDGNLRTLGRNIAAKSPKPLKTLGRKINPLSSENVLIKTGTSFNAAVENNARMAHFLAANDQNVQLFKSSKAAMDASAQSVRKYLFDYSDLSSREQQTFKRISPFYTFTRKAIPLYLEKLVTNPGKFQRLEYAKDALVSKSEYQGEDIPSFIKEQGGIPLPSEITDTLAGVPLVGGGFKKGGTSVFVPDLPFKSLYSLGRIISKIGSGDQEGPQGWIQELLNLAGVGGPAGAGLAVVRDLVAAKNSFSGATMGENDWTEAPSWATVPGVKQVFEEMGLIEPKYLDPNSPPVAAMKDSNIFAGELLLPVLSKIRTIAPSSEKDEAAAARRQLNAATGLNVYPLTKDFRRQAAYGKLYDSETFSEGLRGDYNIVLPRTPPSSPKGGRKMAPLRPISKKESKKRLKDLKAGR